MKLKVSKGVSSKQQSVDLVKLVEKKQEENTQKATEKSTKKGVKK